MKNAIIEALRACTIDLSIITDYDDCDLNKYIRQTVPNSQDLAFGSGVSKYVILIKGENIVLKMPYQGMYDDESFEQDMRDYESNLDDGVENLIAPELSNYYFEFVEAKSDVVETSNNWDYCALECAIYEAAEQEGLEAYFAKEEWYADVNGYPIYCQQRVNPLDALISSSKKTYPKDFGRATSKKCSDMGVRCINTIWVQDFFDYYGELEYKRLMDFLTKVGVYDLHSGNLGYYKGAPILLDYSDFKEW